MPYTIDSSEFKLSICCSAINLIQVDQIVANLRSSHRWDENLFLKFLEKHRIGELASIVLDDVNFFSKAFRLKLEVQRKQNQIKALKAQRTQYQLQVFFTENQIHSIFLKGVILSELYYGDLAYRNVFDIDVWVEEKNIDLVSDFLNKNGYKRVTDQQSFSRLQLKYLQLSSHHEVFVNPNDGAAICIELHWKMRNGLGNYMFDPVLEKNRLMQVELNGIEFNVFSHIDQFIFLSVHGAEHGWFRLKWMADLFHIQKTIDFDWNALFNRAIELRSDKEVKMACFFLNHFYELEIGKSSQFMNLNVFDKLRIRYVEQFIVYPYEYCDTRVEKIKNGIYLLSLNRRGFIAKELMFKNLTRPIDWKTLPLPDYLFFLYFPLRPFLWLYRKVKPKFI
jgi:hypothetical protein